MRARRMINSAQEAVVGHIVETGAALLIGPMGSGKTLTALTAIDECLRGHNKRFLIVAPKKVCEQVWAQEAEKWGLSRLNVAICTGPPEARVAGLSSSANVCVINFENLAWLFSDPAQYARFDGLCIDEVTKLKAGGKAFKSIRRHIQRFSTRVAMSGTPVSEDFTGLFYQAMLVDDGAAYGRNKQDWLEKYFRTTDYRGYQHELVSADALLEPFKHNIVTLPSYSAELPAIREHVITVPDCCTREYEHLRRHMSVSGVTAANAAVLTNKLQQAAGGFLYDDDGGTQQIHNHKLKWLAGSTLGTPAVVVYQYAEELARLKALLPGAHEIKDVEEWRAGGGVLLIHPKSAGHGLDLTAAAVMVFMSPIWSRDLTRQTIARIWRRGQRKACEVYTLVGAGTIEEQIVARERGKAAYHAVLLSALRDFRA